MKIGVVGCGFVGSASAYALVMQGICSELVLIDYNEKLAKAQAEDILHAVPFTHHVNIKTGNYADLEGCAIVMVAAGVNQKPGETRLDLLKRNTDIFAAIIPEILKHAGDAVLLIATNPVDIMTQITVDIAHGLHAHPIEKIIGSGTILDTARFRALIAKHFGIGNHSVHAYVLGEHGDSEVLHWSGIRIGSLDAETFSAQRNVKITDTDRNEIDDNVRRAAYKIIEGKGATYYGIGAGMARIASAIIGNEKAVLTCSSPTGNFEELPQISYSLPRIISAGGIEQSILPDLDKKEVSALQHSAETLFGFYNDLKK